MGKNLLWILTLLLPVFCSAFLSGVQLLKRVVACPRIRRNGIPKLFSFSPDPPRQRPFKKQSKSSGPHQTDKPRNKGSDPLESLNMNLDSLAKSSLPGSASRAQELLTRIEALHHEGYYACAPDIVSWNSVLNAWARSPEKNAPQKAIELVLAEIEQGLEPNIISFNTLIWTFARRGMVEEAQVVLHRMKSRYGVDPDTISYNSVLYALKDDAVKAEELLRKMIHLSDGNPNIKPNTVTFNTVLYSWANSRIHLAPVRAEELLLHMERLYQAGNDDLEPDVYSYTSVILAWAASKKKASVVKAKALLDQMEALAVDRGKRIRPNKVTYTCLMLAFSNTGLRGAAEEANQLLDRMWEMYEKDGDMTVKPDTITFSSVITCWSRENSTVAHEKALELLDRMEDLSLAGHEDICPNSFTYTSVFKTLSRSRRGGSAKLAEELLARMEAGFQAGNFDLEPSVIHYNVILDAHAQCPNVEMATDAYRLYKEMIGLHRPSCTPNIITYNSLLRACANTFGSTEIKQKAFLIASDVFQNILDSKDVRPSSITFVFMFKILRKLLPEGDPMRSAVLKRSFDYCTRAGLLNDIVLQQLEWACSSKHELATLLNLKSVPFALSSQDLPMEWTRNAKTPSRYE